MRTFNRLLIIGLAASVMPLAVNADFVHCGVFSTAADSQAGPGGAPVGSIQNLGQAIIGVSENANIQIVLHAGVIPCYLFGVPGGLLGDMNCDGVVTPADIAGFVLALTNPAEYMMQYPNCDINHADINSDGVITPSDIAGFVELLIGG